MAVLGSPADKFAGFGEFEPFGNRFPGFLFDFFVFSHVIFSF
jgi:hypothetical protein